MRTGPSNPRAAKIFGLVTSALLGACGAEPPFLSAEEEMAAEASAGGCRKEVFANLTKRV